MNKTKRLLALLMAVLLCLSLCGCDRLDEMREAHAFWQEDGTVLWNGRVYKPLPSVSDNINWDPNGEDIFVTQLDVPVLLSQLTGDAFAVSHGGIMLDGFDAKTDAPIQYCRADKYEQVCGMLNDDFSVAIYGYEYYDSETVSYKEYVLTDTQKAAIDKIHATAKKREQTYEDEPYNMHDVSIYGYSEDKLFCRYLFSLVKDEKGAYTLQDDEYIYDVPKADYPLCEEVLKVYMASLDGEGPVAIDIPRTY